MYFHRKDLNALHCATKFVALHYWTLTQVFLVGSFKNEIAYLAFNFQTIHLSKLSINKHFLQVASTFRVNSIVRWQHFHCQLKQKQKNTAIAYNSESSKNNKWITHRTITNKCMLTQDTRGKKLNKEQSKNWQQLKISRGKKFFKKENILSK